MDPDLPLIEALQAGDDSALNELINRHREPLHRFVFRYLRDETAAGDVVQETFVRVYFKAGKFAPKSSVKTWIYTIGLNLCRDYGRRLGRRRADVSLDAPAHDDGPRFEVADSAPAPSVRAADADRFSRLQAAIDRLPRKLKEALVLFALEGRSQNEIAEFLRISPKAVETRVYHAKAKLRAALGSEMSFGDA
ncbi:RNA polymerase sigma factor [Opitutus terrae]|uniref:RNA polymerase, sigma-24 subunit, ECF subfamily n=1 Tax=Opitutus terrae (strain DSM 11246 / JCM 15787 / PB90-1) TaxID=452637 RepID=B1ZRM6_OPITP|nr:RNA polymerase sigma factor [Opitutus terrae]ACB77674.1 RNA polymerase, sigma-24 subunit, ECF subfamily [Opitutus terrae PB90-1]